MNPKIPWPPGVRFGCPLLQRHDIQLFGNSIAQLRAPSPAAASPANSPESGQGPDKACLSETENLSILLPDGSGLSANSLRPSCQPSPTSGPSSAPQLGGAVTQPQIRSSSQPITPFSLSCQLHPKSCSAVSHPSRYSAPLGHGPRAKPSPISARSCRENDIIIYPQATNRSFCISSNRFSIVPRIKMVLPPVLSPWLPPSSCPCSIALTPLKCATVCPITSAHIMTSFHLLKRLWRRRG